MAAAIITEGLGRHHCADSALRLTECGPEKGFLATVGALVELGEQLAVAFEMIAEDFRDAENVLPVRQTGHLMRAKISHRAALEVIVNHIADHFARVTVLAYAMLVVVQLEIEIMVIEQLPQRRL